MKVDKKRIRGLTRRHYVQMVCFGTDGVIINERYGGLISNQILTTARIFYIGSVSRVQRRYLSMAVSRGRLNVIEAIFLDPAIDIDTKFHAYLTMGINRGEPEPGPYRNLEYINQVLKEQSRVHRIGELEWQTHMRKVKKERR